ncbi:DinB family protein [Mycolicibacterium sp. XJ1819]
MQDRCDECAFDQSATPPAKVAVALEQVAPQICESMRSIASDVLRRRPRPEVWAPIEYLGHLRESMAFHRWLIEKALAEDDPTVPMVDPDESVAGAGYRDADLEDLIAQFERRIQRLNAQLGALPPDAERRVITLGGQPITVALVARSAWHECHHHLGDIRRLGGQTTTEP